MTLILTFILVFIPGPVAFWVLAKQRPDRRYIITLGAATMLLIVAAFAANSRIFQVAPHNPYPGLVAIMALWLAWIIVLALCAMALGARAKNPILRRFAFAAGAMATTLPWFGLYTAQVMAR